MNSLSLSPSAALELTELIKAEWDLGAPPDACKALDQHPELLQEKSAVLDLAYTEFVLRQSAGEAVDGQSFAARFPVYNTSIRNVLLVDQHIGQKLEQLNQLEAPWPQPNTVFDVYHIVRELGRGAFARVYLAYEQTTGGRPVALKLSRYESSEACTLGQIDHQAVVPVLSARRDPGTNFYMVCMPYLGNATLLDVLDQIRTQPVMGQLQRGLLILETIARCSQPEDPAPKYQFPGLELDQIDYPEAIFRIGSRLAEAIGFLHREGYYHCDLKPSNVLLTPNGVPLLLDFNLSQKTERPTQRLGGTLPYMAPEQVRAFLHPEEVVPSDGTKVDLFALGVLLYELLCGQHPFGPIPSERTPQELGEVLLENYQKGFRPLGEINPSIDSNRARLIEQCLAWDSAQRPASAEELVRGLFPVVPSSFFSPEGSYFQRKGGQDMISVLPATLPISPSVFPPQPVPVLPLLGKWVNAVVLLACVALTTGIVVNQFATNEPKNELQSDLKNEANPDPPTPPAPKEELLRVESALAQLSDGRQLRDEGKVLEARQLFQAADLALERDIEGHSAKGSAPSWLAYSARGQANLLLDKRGEAYGFLISAQNQLERMPRLEAVGLAAVPWGSSLLCCVDPDLGAVEACLAYHAGLDARHVQAIRHGMKALELGYRTSGTLNNLAYSCIQSGDKNTWEMAGNMLDEALKHQSGPPRPAILYNRCYLASRYFHQNPEIPKESLQEIEETFKLPWPHQEPPKAKLHFLAAKLNAGRVEELKLGLSRENSQDEAAFRLGELRRHILGFLEMGMKLDLPSSGFLFNPVFDAELKKLQATRFPRRPYTPPPPFELVDPVTFPSR